MTERTAERVKNSECIIFSGGHFPTSEDPAKFKEMVTPVLKKIVTNDPERRGQGGQAAFRPGSSEGRSLGRNDRPSGRRVIDL